MIYACDLKIGGNSTIKFHPCCTILYEIRIHLKKKKRVVGDTANKMVSLLGHENFASFLKIKYFCYFCSTIWNNKTFKNI